MPSPTTCDHSCRVHLRRLSQYAFSACCSRYDVSRNVWRERPTVLDCRTLFYVGAPDTRHTVAARTPMLVPVAVCTRFRFHFTTHRELDCAEFCSPEATDDETLWGVDADGEPKFLWNSSVAESSNAWVHGACTEVEH